MTTLIVGFCVSLCVTVLLAVFFRHESVRGARYGEHARARADVLVMKLGYKAHTTLRYVTRDFVKQLGHYSFHTLLRVVLLVMTRMEKWLRSVMRVNRTLAKSAERESTTQSKLEALALHKAEVALTEEEKKEHKERALHGM